jgi:hypothetical protein
VRYHCGARDGCLKPILLFFNIQNVQGTFLLNPTRIVAKNRSMMGHYSRAGVGSRIGSNSRWRPRIGANARARLMTKIHFI